MDRGRKPELEHKGSLAQTAENGRNKEHSEENSGGWKTGAKK